LHGALFSRHLQQFLNGLIEIPRQLLLPLGNLRVARVLHCLRRLLHLRGGVARLVLDAAWLSLLPLLTPLSLLAALAVAIRPLLHRGEVFHGLTSLIAGELLRRALELFHLLHELRCQRLTKELLCVAQLTRQTAIQSPRLLELLFQSRRLLLEVLHALGERALLLGDRTRLFGGFVTHRAVLPTVCFGVGGGCGFAALRAIGALAPILRRIIGSLLQRSLRGRRGLCLAHRRIGGIASHGATLLHRRDLEQ